MSSKHYFDQVAGKWDKLREHFFSDKVRVAALDTADVQAEKIAADIGAGTGFITDGLLKKGLKVIAVDQSETMLRELKRKFGPIDCRVGKAVNLPIEDEAVDYVFANMYLHHVESPLNAIKEMVRILRQGGKLVITDLDKHDYEFLSVEQHDRWLGFDRKNIKQWFKEAGLTDVQINCLGEDCCADSNCGCEDVSISMFVAVGKKEDYKQLPYKRYRTV